MLPACSASAPVKEHPLSLRSRKAGKRIEWASALGPLLLACEAAATTVTQGGHELCFYPVFKDILLISHTQYPLVALAVTSCPLLGHTSAGSGFGEVS